VKPILKVVGLYESNSRQIPEMMRKLAGEIECPPVSGVKVDQALFICRDSSTGKINMYGWGDVGIEDSLAMIAMASHKLSSIAYGGDLWDIPQGGSSPKDSA
jgi:hypothetical protein